MPKRKAIASDVEQSPSKRVTRSNTALLKTQPLIANTEHKPAKRRGRPPGIPAIPCPSTPPNTHPSRRLSKKTKTESTDGLNINLDDETSNASERDELLLSAKGKRLVDREVTPRRSSRRMVMDSVLIVTPSKLTKPIEYNRIPSPSPTRKNAAHYKSSKGSATPQLSRSLPPHFQNYLAAQKRAILDGLHSPPSTVMANDGDEGSEASANSIALQQLTDLLMGTVERREGNSCLIIGPRGSGKTRIFEQALMSLPTKPIIIRLSGYVQHNDRLAMREIARQISIQTGTRNSLLPNSPDEDDNPFIDHEHNDSYDDAEVSESIVTGTLPPSSHLPSLISALPTLSQPVILLLDAFDLFTGHARQALLYCLLDTVQSCHLGGDGNNGVAVVGMTARIDVVNLLEKRVKSRFSHRILRTAGMRNTEEWEILLKECLCSSIDGHHEEKRDGDTHDVCNEYEALNAEWRRLWHSSVDRFLHEKGLKDILRDTFGITRDSRVLKNIMTDAVLNLTPTSPFLSASQILPQVVAQRNPPRFPTLASLSYPSIALLIAAQHVQASGHDAFTFEMLHESFRNQVRASAAAPVTLEGGGIGMMNVGRGVLMGAFEYLIQVRIFRPVTAPAVDLALEFVKHRCVARREEVKAAVESNGQTNLKKWLSKAQ